VRRVAVFFSSLLSSNRCVSRAIIPKLFSEVRMADVAAAILNAMAAQYSATVGATPTFRLRTGAKPALITDASTGTVLVAIVCPATPFTAGATGTIVKNGTWSGTGTATGTAGHYELLTSGGVLMDRGTVTAPGGGGDVTMANLSVATGGAVTVDTWTRTVTAQ
jgi:hypothetical protein